MTKTLELRAVIVVDWLVQSTDTVPPPISIQTVRSPCPTTGNRLLLIEHARDAHDQVPVTTVDDRLDNVSICSGDAEQSATRCSRKAQTALVDTAIWCPMMGLVRSSLLQH